MPYYNLVPFESILEFQTKNWTKSFLQLESNPKKNDFDRLLIFWIGFQFFFNQFNFEHPYKYLVAITKKIINDIQLGKPSLLLIH